MPLDFEHYRVELITLSPLLGATPKDKELYASYVAAKADPPLASAELDGELEDVQDEHVSGWTGFLTTQEGQPYLRQHVILGFLKTACGALRMSSKPKLSKKVTAYKKKIDSTVLVTPDKLLLDLPADLTTTARSLRADTPQGPRVALAMSDTAPTGTRITFYLSVLEGILPAELIREWFEYGVVQGLGQWRGSGKKGKFTATVTKLAALPEDVDPFAPVYD